MSLRLPPNLTIPQSCDSCEQGSTKLSLSSHGKGHVCPVNFNHVQESLQGQGLGESSLVVNLMAGIHFGMKD